MIHEKNVVPKFTISSITTQGETVIRKWSKQNQVDFIDDRQGNIHIEVIYAKGADVTYISEHQRLSNEIFELSIAPSILQGKEITITCSSDRSLWYALNYIRQKKESNCLEDGYFRQYPYFQMRGVVEGFYGEPWYQEQRLDMIRFMSRHNMNTYIYGPKDDIYHRGKWREPYNKLAYDKLKQVFDVAEENYIDFYYGIGPGLSMCYSRDEDIEALISKYKQVYQLGIRNFVLLFDDIPETLQYKQDQESFTDLVDAHIQVTSKVYQSLQEMDTNNKLIVCPQQYYGKGNEYYISKLGSNLHPNIEIFWTGRNICSETLELHESALFTQSTLHKPLYWDNYPVNDVEMIHEMHIGPYRGRDRDLYRFSKGIIANAMEYPESSKFALFTIADYLWNPSVYDPEKSFKKAIKEIVGEKDAIHFKIFADCLRYSCLFPFNAPMLGSELAKFEFHYKYINHNDALNQITNFLEEMLDSFKYLDRGLTNEKLHAELVRWITKFGKGTLFLQECLFYLRSDLLDSNVIALLEEKHLAYKMDPTYIFGEVLDMFFDNLKSMGSQTMGGKENE